MSMAFEGKVALVTGAGSGIGEAVAVELAAAGAAVMLAGRRADRLQAVAERIAGGHGRAAIVPCDVSDQGQAEAAVARSVAEFGRLDILVNSAGVNESGGIEELDAEQWRRVVDINLFGTIYPCRAAYPHMKAQGGGQIVNISSTAGRRAGWRFASYSTSKFGLTGFTEALRQEGGPHGIRVAIVEPGATSTEIAESVSDPQWREMIRQHTHKDGAMDPADIAAAVLMIVTLPPRANVTRLLIQPTLDVEPMP